MPKALRLNTVQSGANYLRPTAIMPGRIAVFGLTYAF